MKRFLRSTGLIFAMRIFAGGMSFLSMAAIARLTNPTIFGEFQFALILLDFAVVFAVFGADKFFLRAVAVGRAAGPRQVLTDAIRRFLVHNAPFIAVASVGLYVALLGAAARGTATAPSLLLAVLAVLLIAFSRVGEGMIRGVGMPVLSNSANFFIRQLAFAAAVAVAWFTTGELTAQSSFSLFVYTYVPCLAALVFYGWIASRSPPDPDVTGTPPAALPGLEFAPRVLTIPLATIALSQLSQQFLNEMPTLFLGMFGDAAQVGGYKAAWRASMIVSLVLQSAAVVLSTDVAKLHADDANHRRLQIALTRSARMVFIICLPITIVGISFSELALFPFGDEFLVAAPALQILLVTKLISTACGPNYMILWMTGGQRYVLLAMTLGVGASVASLWLIGTVTMESAAWGYLVGEVVRNVACSWACRYHAGVDPTILNIFGKTGGGQG